MGRLKKEDKEKVTKDLEDSKSMLEEAKARNNFDITELFEVVNDVKEQDDEGNNFHIPKNTLDVIKKKLAEKKVVKDEETGEDILVPVIKEEERINAIFTLLAERGLNVLDFIERELQEEGFNTKILFALNETFDRATGVLRDIAEMQYKKAELELKRGHLEIQKYKADLKKREIEIKEKNHGDGDITNNILAVSSPAELLKLLSGENDADVDAEVLEEDDGSE
jgi:glutathionylspermidine synthase